ncbi:MAG: hypothetical protein EZS28_051132, partial [Streblomastix strix]
VQEAAERSGEIYLVRFVDEERGFAVSVGLQNRFSSLVFQSSNAQCVSGVLDLETGENGNQSN